MIDTSKQRKSTQISDQPSDSDSEKENIYLGEYHGRRTLEGLRQGYAWCILPNSDVYVGNYDNGMRNGVGLYVFKNGSRYDGQWRNNCKHGQGKMTYPDGSYYEGEWKRNVQHGYGTYCYINGDTYVGNWKNGKKHGLGTYTFQKLNVVIKCIWNNGIQNGSGKILYPSFTFYGTWTEGIKEGKGMFSFHDKCFQKGKNIEIKQESQGTISGIQTSSYMEAELVGEIEGSSDENGDESKMLTSNENQDEEKKPILTEWTPLTISPFDVNLLPPEPVEEESEFQSISDDDFPCGIPQKKHSSSNEEQSMEMEGEESQIKLNE